MNFKNNIAVLEQKQKTVKTNTRRVIKSLEYELIANLVLQQYQSNNTINFDALLSIPSSERIPGFIEEYGTKKMHKLLVMIVREFSMAIPLPKYKKLNDTRISVCACDIMLAAEEDQLSLEDVILFFERAKAGNYKPIKKALTHQLINEMLHLYRDDRHTAYMKIKEAKEADLKLLGPLERTSPEPTALKNLFDEAGLTFIPLKKIG